MVRSALFAALLISVLCCFDVELSVKVLGVALVSEVVILPIFDLVVFERWRRHRVDALNPLNAFDNCRERCTARPRSLAGAAGVGIFFAFWSWVGFEAAPNYAEESKNPKKIVPRAMYISVIGLGILYMITSLRLVSAFPSEDAAAFAAAERPGRFFIPADAVRQRSS